MRIRRNAEYYIAGLVALITFIIYLPSLHNEFIEWDDRYYVFANPFIRSFNAAFFRTAFLDFYASNWHPLTWISHALDYAIWKLNPIGHHLTNNILHAINTFIVVLLVVKLLGTVKDRIINPENATPRDQRSILITAGVTGALFGLHPLHVESVAWVAERKDVLCAMFFLISVIQYIHFTRTEDYEWTQGKSPSKFLNKHYLFSLLFFVLALLSKPMAVTLPVVLLILDWYPFEKIRSVRTFGAAFIEKLPFFAFSSVSAIITLLAQQASGAIKSYAFAPLSSRLLVSAKSLILYLWKMIWPLDLVPFYPYPADVSLLSFKYLAFVALVLGITIFCIRMLKKQKIWLSSWIYFIVTLMPVIGIVQVGQQSMADRYTYLPSLGPFLLLGVAAAEIHRKVVSFKSWRLIIHAVGVILLTCMILLTVRQLRIWKNSIVFWNYVLEKEPIRNTIPYVNLGLAYENKELLDQAIEQYDMALKIDPYDVDAHNDLGLTYEKKGAIDRAIEQYQLAMKSDPQYVPAHFNLGTAYEVKSLLDQAIEQYEIAAKLSPYYVDAHNSLGTVYVKKGLIDQAIEQYRMALRLNPDHVLAHINLGSVYEKKGLLDQAVRHYQSAVRIAPDNALARDRLAIAYEKKGLIALAIEQYEIIVRLKPYYPVAHNHLGTAYLKKGLLDQAIEQYKAALTLQPDDFDAHTNLGVAYKEKGVKDQAIEQFRIALKLKPQSPLAHNNLGIAYGMFGLTDQAIKQFRIAVELDPADENWRKNLAMAYEQRRLSR